MNKTLTEMNEAFIERAERSVLKNVPITALVGRKLPVLPTDKWHFAKRASGSRLLIKTFKFQNNEFRDRFIVGMLEYEKHCEHRAVVKYRDMEVTVTLETLHIEKVTELDKEYSRFCDTLYRDVIYDDYHGHAHRHGTHSDES